MYHFHPYLKKVDLLEVNTQSLMTLFVKRPPSSISRFVNRLSDGGCAAAVLPRGAGLDYPGTTSRMPRLDETSVAR